MSMNVENVFAAMQKRRAEQVRMDEEARTKNEDGFMVEEDEHEEQESEKQGEELENTDEENLNEAKKKVVRDGEVTTVEKKTTKKRLTSAQKAALAKARKKAHTASANKSRAKSIKKGCKAGLYEQDDDTLVCPECGYVGDEDEFYDEEGNCVCPECGAELECEEEDLDEGVKKVVRNGKVVTIKKKTTKKRLTSAQKAALAKARKKAHTASANKSRAKSVKKGAAAGLYEGNDSEVNEEVDVAELAARLQAVGASDFMMNALNEGKVDLVVSYLEIKEGE